MDRRIFKYDDGNGWQHVDPVTIHRALNTVTAGRFNEFLRQAQDKVNDAVALPALQNVILAARHAFSMPPIDRATGTGVLEDDVMRVLWEFLDFLEKKNPPPASSPTSAPPTAPTC